MTVSEALFWVSVGYFGWVGHYFGWIRVSGDVWGIILGRKIFWVGRDEWGWVGVGALFGNAHFANMFAVLLFGPGN